MLNRWVENRIKGFEDLTGQSADYLRDIYEGSHSAFFKYLMFQQGIGAHQSAAPSDALAVVAIAVMRQQDCGPCMQITMTFAEMENVDEAVLRAAFDRDLDALPAPLDMVYLYAEAVVRSDWKSADYEPLVRAHYGDAAMVDFALRIASSAVYPTLKRALGHGHACTSVKIGGKVMAAPRVETHDETVAAVA